DRSVLEAKIRSNLKDKEERLKPDKALSFFALGYYCWQYALSEDAMRFLDPAFEKDDFPALVRAFAGKEPEALVQTWYEATGKSPPRVSERASVGGPPKPLPGGDTPRSATPDPSRLPAPSATDDTALAKAR